MDASLQRLYQELILDHNARPRNFGPLKEATHRADGHNPMCGDQLTLRLQLQGEHIVKIRCEAQGCAISRASASLMGAAIEGKSQAQAQVIFNAFHKMVTEQLQDDDDVSCDPHAGHRQEGLDALDDDEEEEEATDPAMVKLQALAGVRAFPMRVKCATLAWHTLISALAGRTNVTTDQET